MVPWQGSPEALQVDVLLQVLLGVLRMGHLVEHTVLHQIVVDPRLDQACPVLSLWMGCDVLGDVVGWPEALPDCAEGPEASAVCLRHRVEVRLRSRLVHR